MAAAAMKETTMAHYYVIAERGSDGGWFLTFPHGGAGYSFAESAEEIVSQAQDWLGSVLIGDGRLPLSIEDGARPPADLSEFEKPTIVVVVPYEPATLAKAA
jgi:predicted RNase H-like HicB family nuclease